MFQNGGIFMKKSTVSNTTPKAAPTTAITTKTVCMTGLFTAIVCIATMAIQIPIPLGYAHLGDCMLLLAALCLGTKAGAFAGGVGSALADCLTGYPYWAPATLIIKTFMGIMAALMLRNKEGHFQVFSLRSIAAVVITLLFMTVGYVIAGAILAGNIGAGLASAPGLLLKSAINAAIFFASAQALKKVHLV